MCEPAFYSREARLQELLEQTRRDDAQARYRQAARRRGRPRATARGRARRGAIAPAQSPVRRGQQEEDERWKTLRAWDELAGWIVCADHRRRRIHSPELTMPTARSCALTLTGTAWSRRAVSGATELTNRLPVPTYVSIMRVVLRVPKTNVTLMIKGTK
jgi:hypothetical protein